MKTSETIGKIIPAWMSVKKELTPPGKDSTGYGYNYTSLDHLLNHLRPILEKYDLLLTQEPINDGGRIGIKTTLYHISGEFISSPGWVADYQIINKNTTQSVGAALTYYRRYALAAFFSLAAEKDNDGDLNKDDDSPDKAYKGQITNIKNLIEKAKTVADINIILSGFSGYTWIGSAKDESWKMLQEKANNLGFSYVKSSQVFKDVIPF